MIYELRKRRGFTPLESVVAHNGNKSQARERGASSSLTGLTPLESFVTHNGNKSQARERGASSSLTGFTLIEILLALAVLFAISGFGIFSLSGFGSSRGIETTLQKTEAVLQATQKRSIAQEEGSAWGVYFVNAPGGQTYETYQGSGYTGGVPDQRYSLSRGVSFSQPYASSTVDLPFSSVSGIVSSPSIFSFVSGSSGSRVGTLFVNSLGLFTTRLEKEVLLYFHMDEGVGSLLRDASGRGAGATLIDSSWKAYPSCRIGFCIHLNGSTGYGYGTTSKDVSVFTIEGWVRLDSSSSGGSLVSLYFGESAKAHAGFLASSRKPSFYTSFSGVGDDITDASVALQTDSWNHLAYVYDGTSKKIYINGELNVSQTISGGTISIDNFEIGRRDKSNGDLMAGDLDEVMLYARALSFEEVRSHYNDFR